MIAILTQCFPSRIGGIESLISNLAMGLSKVCEVVVFADKYDLVLDTKYDNKVSKFFLVNRTSGIKFLRRRKKIKSLEKFILSNKIDCVIADSWKSFELSIELLKKNKIPTICLAHGNEIIQTQKNKIDKIIKIYNQCDSIVANSNYTLSLIKNLGLTKPKLEKIYPAAESLEKIDENKNHIIKGSPIILTLGRLEKRKGHINVLSAIRNLKNEFHNLKYIIAGEGPELKNLKDYVNKHKLYENVVFLNKIDDSEKKYIFSITDLMVMPTLDESKKKSIEGFGIVYIESALNGIPSIATNIGGTPEAVLHNKTGIIINRIDELETNLSILLKNKNKRVALGNEAKIRASKDFNWNKITSEYTSLISNIKKN